ncbi:hypothetical protein P4O66_004383 [Electrophorus voltai]|uniref:Uncharacterized protein n=1 Tax=Electrophorus voltai TaxID=2609070 RepID=A0AAD9E2L1_9TELE|nr:hypothetical protein P4O66_004383 [Electrophorus voltai]
MTGSALALPSYIVHVDTESEGTYAGSKPLVREVGRRRSMGQYGQCIKAGDGCPAISPQCPAISPQYPAITPQYSAITPHCPAMSPQYPDITPQCPAISPQCPAISPQYPAITPQCPAITPQYPAITPQCRDITPQCPAITPQCPDITPQCPAISPQCPAISPQYPAITPQYSAITPQCHDKTPQCPAISPLYPDITLRLPRGQGQVVSGGVKLGGASVLVLCPRQPALSEAVCVGTSPVDQRCHMEMEAISSCGTFNQTDRQSLMNKGKISQENCMKISPPREESGCCEVQLYPVNNMDSGCKGLDTEVIHMVVNTIFPVVYELLLDVRPWL